MKEFKLFMMLLGAKPDGRHTEQHDIFFSIGEELKDCLPEIKAFWRGAKSLHIDGWRNVSFVDGYTVKVVEKVDERPAADPVRLFFINLGGYKPGEFEEFHYKMIIASNEREKAIQSAKKAAFFRHHELGHVDDKYGIDVDDVYNIEDILPDSIKEKYTIVLTPADSPVVDEIHLGYFRLDRL